MATTDPDDLLDGAQEIARHLRVSAVTVYRLTRGGRLPVHRVGRRIRARKSVLNAWIEEQERANAKGIDLPPMSLFDYAAE